MPDILTMSTIAATWKLLGSLYEKYAGWSGRRRTSAESKRLQARAEELMNLINRAILSGKSSDDAEVAPLVNEFKALLEKGTGPTGSDMTAKWIGLSGRYRPSTPTAKKAPAKKAAAKKPAAKKAPKWAPVRKAAKRTPAKKAVAKKAAKKAAAKKVAMRRVAW
jgi:hypothetical protein